VIDFVLRLRRAIFIGAEYNFANFNCIRKEKKSSVQLMCSFVTVSRTSSDVAAT
jgi:hypothetical protein